jgi:hypothetical protein
MTDFYKYIGENRFISAVFPQMVGANEADKRATAKRVYSESVGIKEFNINVGAQGVAPALPFAPAAPVAPVAPAAPVAPVAPRVGVQANELLAAAQRMAQNRNPNAFNNLRNNPANENDPLLQAVQQSQARHNPNVYNNLDQEREH